MESPGPTGLEGVYIVLKQGGNVIAETQSGDDGSYEFHDLTSGVYQVCEDLSRGAGVGRVQTHPGGNDCYDVTLQPNTPQGGFDFYNCLPPTPTPTPTNTATPTPTNTATTYADQYCDAHAD